MKVLGHRRNGIRWRRRGARVGPEGTDVRVLVRPNSPIFKTSTNYRSNSLYGDLRDPASLRKALNGCQQLYHVAAHYALWAKDPAIFYDINVTGTRHLSKPRAKSVRTYRSIAARSAPSASTDGGLGTEKTPVSLDQMAGHYKRSNISPNKRC